MMSDKQNSDEFFLTFFFRLNSLTFEIIKILCLHTQNLVQMFCAKVALFVQHTCVQKCQCKNMILCEFICRFRIWRHFSYSARWRKTNEFAYFFCKYFCVCIDAKFIFYMYLCEFIIWRFSCLQVSFFAEWLALYAHLHYERTNILIGCGR